LAETTSLRTVSDEKRDLQLGGLGGGITDTICGIVLGNQLQGNSQCTCDVANRQVQFNCVYAAPFCLASLCANPGYQGTIGLGGGGVTTEFSACLSNINFNGGTSFDRPFCVRIPPGQGGGGGGGGGDLLSLIRTILEAIGLGGGSGGVEANGLSNTKCDITIGEEKCNSCSRCDDGKGITYDCENIKVGCSTGEDESTGEDKCESFDIIDGFGGGGQSVAPFIPKCLQS
jgi:hypothetical protein